MNKVFPPAAGMWPVDSMNGSGLGTGTTGENDRFWNVTSLHEPRRSGHKQRIVKNLYVLGLTNRDPGKPGPVNFQQPTKKTRGDKMETKMPIGQRISRFLETRYVNRSHPHYLPEFAGFGLILILAVWPMLSLVAMALERMR